MSLPDPLPDLLQKHLRLHAKQANQVHLLLRRRRDLTQAAESLRANSWRLITMFATDERMDEDCRMKIYYLFAPGDGACSQMQRQEGSIQSDVLLVLEHNLPARPRPPKHLTSFSPTLRFYASIRHIYPSVQPFEEAIADMYGLLPELPDAAQVQRLLSEGHLLHHAYAQIAAPLRRTRSYHRLKEHQPKEDKSRGERKYFLAAAPPPWGMSYLPVGPIHAGVIEPGRFLFLQAGEPIEKLNIRLGYAHKGIEKLFETHYLLQNGWQLAQRVSGDAAYSHALAYSQAVESLARVQVPRDAQLWRAILLELERIAHHIHDTSGLMHDISLHIVGSQMGLQWETLSQMYAHLFGDRFLRDVAQPGGVSLPKKPWNSKNRDSSLALLRNTLEDVVSLYLSLALRVLIDASVQDRMVGTGELTCQEAENWGAVGFVARASGLIRDDIRVRHPQGVYASDRIQRILARTFAADQSPASPERWISLTRTDMRGDVYARFLLRLTEVETAFYLIDAFLEDLQGEKGWLLQTKDIGKQLHDAPVLDSGLGYVESWRGGVYYWVMKGPRSTIARCSITGPSILNWFIFPRAVVRKVKNKKKDEGANYNILADFPLINKSFNLSYAEHDL